SREFGVMVLLIFTVAVTSLVNHNFLSLQNIRDMLANAAPGIIVACGMTLVIITGEIDISVGSLMGLAAAMLGLLTSGDKPYHWPVWAGILVVMAIGSVAGLINGLLVTVAKVPSIIVTLAMLTILRAITQLIMNGEWYQALPDNL